MSNKNLLDMETNQVRLIAGMMSVVLCTLLVLSGCAGRRLPDDATLSLTESTIPEDYIISAGDSLSINVWNNAELSAEVPVRPDGRISSPLVDDVIAAGKTPRELAADIETSLEEYVRSPQVTVIVTNFSGGYSQQIRVIGQAVEPQALPFQEGMTVLDVVIAVGGLSEFAAGNRAQIIRNSVDGQGSIPVRLDDLINRGNMRYNLPMRRGDVLLIPESRF